SARHVRGKIATIRHRVNVETLAAEAADGLEMNSIAAAELETSSPLFFDSYQQNRTTGSFIVIDPLTNATLAAGMIQELLYTGESVRDTPDAEAAVTRFERQQRHQHYPAILLAGARAALARSLERALFKAGFAVKLVEKKDSLLATRTAWATLLDAGFVV